MVTASTPPYYSSLALATEGEIGLGLRGGVGKDERLKTRRGKKERTDGEGKGGL
jgi:hypothetical protein